MSDSSQAPLISLPLKTTEEVDLGSAVKALIVNSYGEEPSGYAEQTSQLNRARQDAVRGAGSDSTARDLLYKWFHMLEMLELRFPELRVPFPWKDAFTHKSISQSSLAYEKASIIFNIAATLSSLASSQPRLADNPDGLKRAYAALRQAAGMLSYINENFLHAPSTDMSKDIVKALVGLMLAQASEVFLEKSIEEKKSSGLVAKLASYTSAAYALLVEESKDFVGKGYFERSWSHLIQAKAKYFSSLTQYHRALADAASGNHGHGLVRLTVAESHAKEAQKLALVFNTSAPASISASRPSLPSDAATALSALVTNHLAICTERKDAAVKDNDLIYHDILPSESTLAPVDKLVAATPISIQDIFAAPEVQRVIGPDLFQRLIPLGVHESASMYSEEKAKIARAESERHDVANGELQAALEYMGLPGSLKKYRSVGKGPGDGALDALADPGVEVMRWSDEEAQGGGSRGADGLGTGTDGVASALDRIARLRSQASSSIESATAALDDENRECEKQRVRYGHRWTQDPAGLHTREMRASLKENREALQQATANDQRIQELWESIRGDISLLVGGREALEAAFAAAISGSSSGLYGSAAVPQQQSSLLDVGEEEERADDDAIRQVQAKLRQIDEGLVMLHKMQKDRGEVLASLKEKIQTDDISQLLVLNRRSQNVEPAIFAQELEKFKVYQTRIAVSLHHQQVVLAEVTQGYKDLTTLPAARKATKTWDEKERARNGLVARLKRAKEGHAEVRAAVARGLQFYTDLGEITDALRRNVNAYVAERKREREKLNGELEWDDKLRGHGGGGGASPVTSGRPSGGVESLQGSFAGMGLGSSQAPTPSTAYQPPPQQQQPYRQGSYPPSAQAQSYASPPPHPSQQSYASPPLPPSRQSYASPPPPAPSQAAQPYPPPSTTYEHHYQPSHTMPYAKPPPPPPSAPTSTTYHSTGNLPAPPSQFQHSSTFSPPPPPSVSQSTGYPLPPQQQHYGQSYTSPLSIQQEQYEHVVGGASGQTVYTPQQGDQALGQGQYGGYYNQPPPPTQQQQQQQQQQQTQGHAPYQQHGGYGGYRPAY